MAAVLSFDILRFVDCLKAGGIAPSHAETQARALSKVFEANADALVATEDLKQFEGFVDNKFELLRKDVQGLEGRLVKVEDRMGALEDRVGAVENRLGAIEGKLEGIEGQFKVMVGRLEAMEDRLDVKLVNIELRLATRLEKSDGEMKLIRWMFIVVVGGITALITKSFF